MRQRYETHHEKLMSLYVTRQDQEFVVASDLQLVDINLVRSSVELVGEPGWAGAGQVGKGMTTGVHDTLGASVDLQKPGYGCSINELYAMNTSTSTTNGLEFSNGVQHKASLNHGWVNVGIRGMTDNTNFLQDDRSSDNQLQLMLPTDSGLLHARTAQQSGPPTPFMLENVKLQAKIRVHVDFAGTAPQQERVARFVEDFADANPSTYRQADGKVKYYTGSAPGPCQIPANLINCMVLQFKVKPRSTI